MRRIIFAIVSTTTALMLLFSYHTSTSSVSNATAAGNAVVRQGASSGPGVISYTGAVADTRWGPVQVRISVQGGKISASEAVRYPTDNGRDAMINGYALPILNQETVQQQSATIDTVSGATVTSEGYRHSLQFAIDQAHL